MKWCSCLYGARTRGTLASMKAKGDAIVRTSSREYEAVLADVVRLVESARSAASRSVNAVMTATYWAIGQRIVEHEQG